VGPTVITLLDIEPLTDELAPFLEQGHGQVAEGFPFFAVREGRPTQFAAPSTCQSRKDLVRPLGGRGRGRRVEVGGDDHLTFLLHQHVPGMDDSEDEIFYSLKEAVDYFTNPANPNTQLTRHYCGKQTWWDESHFNNAQMEKLSKFINKKFCRKFTLKTPDA
jgi:hypothetical protein